jgi:hypothetical protein
LFQDERFFLVKLTVLQQKILLAALVATIVLLNVRNFMIADKPQTAPLAYPRGSVARSAVRQNLAVAPENSDALSVIIAGRGEKYPGVSRDIFRMENPAPKPKSAPMPVVVAPAAPAVPEKTPQEIAAELAQAELGHFRYLGYLTDRDNTLFLSKDGELFMVKAGETVQKTYKVKEATKDAVVMRDTATGVEARIELSGSDGAGAAQPGGPPQMQQHR